MYDNNEHKLFWNYVQFGRKGSNDLIVIKLDNGNVLANERDISEIMNEYFASVFTTENFDNFPSFDQVIKDKDLSLLHCSPKDVSKILSELKPRNSPGPDSIHPMILEKCARTLAPSLSDVFNGSLESGKLPQNWKLADITPLHKKGAKKDRKNYRPVSLTSVVCKVCKMIVRQQLVQFWITKWGFLFQSNLGS